MTPGMRMLLGMVVAVPLWAHEPVSAPAGSAAGQASSELPATAGCARYLGNEGVLVSHGETKILFDAFYADSYGQYVLVPEPIRHALIAGEPPYDGVDALFVSHVHGDHFSAAGTMAFLNAHPEVTLYASGQVVQVLQDHGVEKLPRIQRFDLQAGDPAQSLTVGALTIDVVRIPHAGGPGRAAIENLAFRVALNDDLTVLHLGDADPDVRHFAPHQSHWDARMLDVAFPPYWFYRSEDGPVIMEKHLQAKRTIGVHVPGAAIGHGDRWRQEHGGDLFTDPGEVRVLRLDGCDPERAR